MGRTAAREGGNLTTPPTALAATLLTVLVLGAPLGAHARDLVIRNARLVDGTGAPARTGLSILVRGGRIAEIAQDVSAPDLPVLDA